MSQCNAETGRKVLIEVICSHCTMVVVDGWADSSAGVERKVVPSSMPSSMPSSIQGAIASTWHFLAG